MQRIAAFFTTLFIMAGSFFVGLPHMVYPWDKPGKTVTDTAQVLALYQEIAKKNTNTEFREIIKDLAYGVPGQEMKPGPFSKSRKIIRGMPGEPAALEATDLISAKAEHYHNGRTVVITLKLRGGDNQAVSRAIGGITIERLLEELGETGSALFESPVLQYKNPSVMIRVNAASGKIVAANYSCQAITTLTLNFGSRNQARMEQDYTIKKP